MSSQMEFKERTSEKLRGKVEKELCRVSWVVGSTAAVEMAAAPGMSSDAMHSFRKSSELLAAVRVHNLVLDVSISNQ